jgi:hypothetical protein
MYLQGMVWVHLRQQGTMNQRGTGLDMFHLGNNIQQGMLDYLSLPGSKWLFQWLQMRKLR